MNRTKAIIIIFSLFLFSCSGTKSLKNGEVLYTGSRIHVKKTKTGEKWKIDKGVKKLTQVYWAMWDTPNGALLGLPQIRFIPFRLYLYNIFYNEKDKGFSRWLRENFGEKPVLIQDVDPALKVEKGINIYENFGHFGTTGSYSLNYRKKNKKAYIHYRFLVPPAYTYRNINYEVDSSQQAIANSFLNYQNQAILHPNDEFNLNLIKKEKLGIWNYLQNHGYYYLKQEDVVASADTAVGNKQIDVRIELASGLPERTYQKESISGFSLMIDSVMQENKSEKYYRWGTGKMKKSIFDSLVKIAPGEIYSLQKSKKVVQNISELGVFGNPRINYIVEEKDSLHLKGTLAMDALDATGIGVNVNGNYKNIGYLGPSVGLSLDQLNVFGGAENLTMNLDAYYDFPIGLYRERNSNSSGVSLRSVLSAPLLKSPLKFVKSTVALPKKIITLNADLNFRKDYFDLIAWNASYGYLWKSSPKITHKLDLVNATYSDILNTTPRFDSLVVDNPLLRTSLVNQFLLGTSYTFRFDNSETNTKKLGTFFEGKAEFSGNALSLLNSVFTSTPNGEKKILGVPYSQFSLFSTEFRAYLQFGTYNQLAFRNVLGLGLAYGNSHQMPYIKQFFIGGSNSLRPFNARNVGPGRYIELDQAEINQVGDFKMEFNLEYRFRIGLKLNGAIWSDAGNIWLLEEDPNRPFSGVRWGKLFEDSYLTGGIGLRLDLGFLTLRADYGAVWYAPIFIEGYKWIWQNKLPLHGPVIGFGYPF